MASKGQAAVSKKATEVEQGTLRHQVLLTAQKFKSSWVELGAMLVKVRNEGAWEEWGFASFEEYCSKELRLKRQTALKLTNSYSFLARHEKSLLENGARHELRADRPVPPFEVVSVLAGAEERGQLSEEEYKDLRESIWSEDRPSNDVVRELSQRFPPPPKPALPIDMVLRKLASAARRLANDLKSCDKVPNAVSERAVALAEDVEELASQE